jgi:hypothetical protein
VLLVLTAAAATVAYLGTLGHGFVYDDHRFVEWNPGIDAVASAPWKAFDPATTSLDGAEPGMWRPLRTLSYGIDRALFGTGPEGMHLHSALLHGVATALVFAVGAALGLGDLAAAAGAALFAFHPVQVEAVAWISSRGDLLAAVFTLAAVLVHLRQRPAWATACLAGLGFLSKESAVAAPLLLLVADLAAGGRERVAARWRPVAATTGVLVALVAVRAAALSSAGASFGQGPGLGLGFAGTLAAIPSMLAWYGWRTLVPTAGTFDLQLGPTLLLSTAFVGGAALLAAWPRVGLPAAGAARARAAAAWALAALLPVTLLQLLFPLGILVADRFLYLGFAGPALAAAAAADSCGERRARSLLVVSVLLLLVTLPATGRWASDETLWGDTLRRDPGHPRALHGLAFAKEASDPAGSRRLYANYLEDAPGDAGAWLRLGMTAERLALNLPPEVLRNEQEARVARRGYLLEAAQALGKAIALWDGGAPEGRSRGLTEARLARACALASLGDQPTAEDEAEAAFRAWTVEPPERRKLLEPRVEILRRWARETGRKDLASVLEGKTPALPGAPR